MASLDLGISLLHDLGSYTLNALKVVNTFLVLHKIFIGSQLYYFFFVVVVVFFYCSIVDLLIQFCVNFRCTAK